MSLSIIYCEPHHTEHTFGEKKECRWCGHWCFDHITRAQVCLTCPVGDKCIGFKEYKEEDDTP